LLHGHYALLGAEDAVKWNHRELWKHAWRGAADAFFCFGMTSMGDQFAFRVDEMGERDRVWMLDAFELSPTVVAGTFERFLDDLLERAAKPDDLVAGAHERHGPMALGQLFAVAPPIQFGTKGLLERLRPMPAGVVMTFYGDTVAELERCAGRPITKLDMVMDERGRPRLRLVAAQDH
jgi:hypothetical protein